MKKVKFILVFLTMATLFSFTTVGGGNSAFEDSNYHELNVSLDLYYGGSASARVINDDGETRVINATTRCIHETKSAAKSSLKNSLDNYKYSDEDYDSSISYDIETCE